MQGVKEMVLEMLQSPEFWSYATLPILMGLTFGLNGSIPGESKLRPIVAVSAGSILIISLTVAFALGGASIGALALVLAVVTCAVSGRFAMSLAPDALKSRRR